ncbi:MAG TPA: hypothetical protein VID03_06415 [Acidimicrobiia bacterium]|jgi:hypothetical protein
MVAKLFVESWAPDYGAPLEVSEERQAASKVDPGVEIAGVWEPLDGDPREADEVVFVDGVRRVDARLTLDDPIHGPLPGLCGSFGVGAVRWKVGHGAAFEELQVQRLAILGGGARPELPGMPGLDYRPEAVGSDDPAALVAFFHSRMRAAEAVLAGRLAEAGNLVFADGPINELRPQTLIGYVKTHRVNYLGPDLSPTISRLRAGQRTPIFLIEAEQYARYSWYLRLADLPHGHSWTGVVRCEAPASLGIDQASRLASCSAGILPRVASESYIDPRAPQNLVPIAALEKELRRRLGDPALLYRSLLTSVAGRQEVPA